MKALKYLSLIAIPVFLAACTVEEDRGTDDQLTNKNTSSAPKASRAPTTEGRQDSGESPVDNSFSGVKPSQDKKDSEDGELSDYEKQSLEAQKKQQELLEKKMAQEEARHESIREMEKEGLKLQRMTAYGIFALMGQWMESMQAMGLGTRPGIPEDCETGAVGTLSNSNDWSRFMRHLETQIEQDLGGPIANENAENADFRSGESNSVGNSISEDAEAEAEAETAGEVPAASEAAAPASESGENSSENSSGTNAEGNNNEAADSSDTQEPAASFQVPFIGPVHVPDNSDGWLGIPYVLPNQAPAAAPAAVVEDVDSNS